MLNNNNSNNNNNKNNNNNNIIYIYTVYTYLNPAIFTIAQQSPPRSWLHLLAEGSRNPSRHADHPPRRHSAATERILSSPRVDMHWCCYIYIYIHT